MLQVNFFLRGAESAASADNLFIYCQPAIDGGIRGIPFSTRMKCQKAHWNGTMAKEESPYYSNTLSHLTGIKKRLLDIWQMLPILHPVENPSLHLLMHYYNNGTSKRLEIQKPKLLKVYEMLMESKQVKASTLRTYRTKKNNLIKFLNSKNDHAATIDRVDHKFLNDFHTWLTKNGQAQNTANKHITTVRAVIQYSVEQNYLKSFPLGSANLKFSPPGEPKYLVIENRKAIANVKLKSLEKERDIAIFLMATGFSYIDYCSLESRHLIESDGRFCWKKEREKTHIFSMPPLLPEAARIIEKYGSIEALPKIDLNDYNKSLKILGEIAGLTKQTVGFNLSTSVFRETFSSMCENEMMFSERAVMFFMGHTNTKQLSTYSRIQPSRIFREMDAAKQYSLIAI